MIDFKLFGGFAFRQTDRRTNKQTDFWGCRVAFATENLGVFKGGVEESLAFKELSMKSYGKLIILKSTGL